MIYKISNTRWSDNYGSESIYDKDLKKTVTVRNNIRRFGYGGSRTCDFCEHFGGIYKGTTCVANTFPPEEIGHWVKKGKRVYTCNLVLKSNGPTYRHCSETDRTETKCYPIGSEEECFTGRVYNPEDEGNELCEFNLQRCES
jgi:hypothetical protein